MVPRICKVAGAVWQQQDADAAEAVAAAVKQAALPVAAARLLPNFACPAATPLRCTLHSDPWAKADSM